MDKDTANKLAALFGAEAKISNMKVAPEMGGDFKSDGLSFSKGNLSADVGKYSTRTGENYYGFGGYQPLSIGGVRLGGALGAYGPDLQNVNRIAGLLASKPLFGGEVKAVWGPGGNLMLSYDKSF